MEAQYVKFLNMIQAVQIIVHLVDVLAGMPNYGKFLKEIVSNKHKLEQTLAAFLSDESSALIQNKVPPKLGDPESFLIPCNFNKAFSCDALTLKPTQMSVRLADISFQYPIGIAKNMLVKVGKSTFPIDFVILKIEEDGKVSIILRRPFLHTADAVIRVKQKQLNLGVGTKRMTFHMDSAMKHSYSNNDTCFNIDVINEILEEDFDALLDEENSESESDTKEPPFEKITFNTDYKINTSREEPPTDLELKPLPDNLEYAFLEEPSFLPVIISSQLSEENKNILIENDETSDDSDVDDNFPGETLMEITTKAEPWFADFANYLTDGMIRRCVSGPETRTILDQCHHGPTGGHYGPNTTAKRVLDSGFYWPTIIKEAHTLVHLCESCQKTGNISKRDKMPLNNIQVQRIENEAKTVRSKVRALEAGSRLVLGSVCMSTCSSSSNLVPPSTNPESIIRNRQRNHGDSSLLLDFEEINMVNDPNNVQGPPPMGPNFQNPNPDLRPIKELLQAPTDGVGDAIVIDTFYNCLNQSDQDSLNYAAGEMASGSLTQDAHVTGDLAPTKQVEALLSSMNRTVNSIQNGFKILVGGPTMLIMMQAAGGSLKKPSVPSPPSTSSKEVERDPKLTTDQVLTESTTGVPPSVVQPSPASTYSELPPAPVSSPVIPKKNPHQPPIPYPSSFAEALAHMSKFAKIVKDLLTNKEKLIELENTPLNENCSAVLLKNLPKKLRDTGRFLIPCDFYRLESCMALADLGASINSMPLSVWKKLSLPKLTPTRMTLELATRIVAYPDGIAKDVFIQVGKFTLSADFVVVDYDVDPRVPLILGRPFLRTTHALVDVHGEELTLRVGDEKLVFNFESTSKYPLKHGDESIYKIDILDITCEDHFHEVLDVQKSINPLSGSPTPSPDPVVTSLSPSLTPFWDSDFILEEIDTFLASDNSTSPFDPEGDIRLIEELLNNEILNDLPPHLLVFEINETKKIKTSIDDPPDLELKDLPPHLEYAFLEGTSKLPVIIAKDLKREEKNNC
ncbi:reverse transcriptase domain-containing protein [Tanacetum coccineum]